MLISKYKDYLPQLRIHKKYGKLEKCIVNTRTTNINDILVIHLKINIYGMSLQMGKWYKIRSICNEEMVKKAYI